MKMAMILYSEIRKVMAPSWIASAISRILSLPVGCLIR